MTGETRKTEFKGAGGEALAAALDLPHKPRAYALFAHCFSCTKDIKAAREIARALRAEGFAVMRFDFTGLGASEGEFANTNFSSNVDDLVAAADFLRETYEAPSIIIGHSLGGAAAIVAVTMLEDRVYRTFLSFGHPVNPSSTLHFETRRVVEGFRMTWVLDCC